MWWWILFWVLLLVAAVAVLGLLGWRLVKQIFGLGGELGVNAGRFADAFDQIRPPGPAVTSSVFLDADAQPVVHPRSRSSWRRRA